MSQALRTAVASQRLLLQSHLTGPLAVLAKRCAAHWPDSMALEPALQEALTTLSFCKYLYALDAEAHQITANITPGGPLPEHLGRDRSVRPYVARALAGETFSLSDAYISRNARRPSLTAMQRVTSEAGELLGWIGADFDLRELPLTRELYTQPDEWVQLKGDPSIRGGLFAQQRVES